MNMHIQDAQACNRIPLPPIRFHHRPHKRLPQHQVRQLMHTQHLCIRLEELCKEPFECEVVDVWIWVEEVEIDVDNV